MSGAALERWRLHPPWTLASLSMVSQELVLCSKSFLTVNFSLPQWMKTWKISGRKAKGCFAHHVSQRAHRPREEEATFLKIRWTFCECGCGSTDLTLIPPKRRNSTYRRPPTYLCFKYATGSSMREGEYCLRWFVVKDETPAITRSREGRTWKILRRTACTNGV